MADFAALLQQWRNGRVPIQRLFGGVSLLSHKSSLAWKSRILLS